MFHVKICGVMTAVDARMACDAGADAVGLNFVDGSPRRLDVDAALAVAAAVPRGVAKVGVFAGTAAADILHVARAVGLDAVQLHGHFGGPGPVDPPARCGELCGVPVIRAVRLEAGAGESDRLATARRWIEEALLAGAGPVMALVDAAATGTAGGGLGGTGALVDWMALARAGALPVPLALAGGLTPSNVAEAIRVTGVRAVDTASGVETAPGRKDPAKVAAFVAAARRAMGMR
jgi:phosphoribosylanthranilate isomerase